MDIVLSSILIVLVFILGAILVLCLLCKLAVSIWIGLGVKVLVKHLLLHKVLVVAWQKAKKLFSRFKKGKGGKNTPPIIKE